MSEPKVTKMDMPQFYDLFNPTLTVLKRLGGSASINELVDELIDELEVPDEVAELPHGDGSYTEFGYRNAWARTYLKKAGLLDNSKRGVWALTAGGLETEEVDPKELVRQVRQRDKERRQIEGDDEGEEKTAVRPDGRFSFSTFSVIWTRSRLSDFASGSCASRASQKLR